MISFPWDSLVEGFDEETGFPLYDRGYSAEQLRDVYATFFSNGVFLNEANAFQVTPSAGMNLIVASGKCLINGTVGYEANMRELAIQASDNTYDRIDTIVLRWNANIDTRNIDLYVRQGVAQAIPVRPTLVRNETVYELGIADIYVNAKAGAISAARITDTRLQTARCGAVTPFATIDTTTFYNQIQAAIDERMAELKEQTDKAVDLAQSALDGTIAGNLQSQIDDVSSGVEAVTNDLASTKTDVQKINDAKVNRSGDTMTGSLTIHAGTANGSGEDNGFRGTMNTGTVFAGNKAKLFTDNEGGSLQLESPSGIFYHHDAFNGNLRCYGSKNGTIKGIYTANGTDGTFSLNNPLAIGSGGTGANTASNARSSLGLTNIIGRATYSASVTVSANGVIDHSWSMTIPTGYDRLLLCGAAGCNTGNLIVGGISISSSVTSGKCSGYARIRNPTSSSQTSTLTIPMIFIKNEFVSVL